MKKLVQEKENAIALRKKGLSYNQILKQVPVAKSSLSLWLKDLPLTPSEKQTLKKRVDKNISHGRIKAAAEIRKNRLSRERIWVTEATELFIKYTEEPMFHAGIAMYWAEGAKTSTTWMIVNTDVDVLILMRKWVKKYLQIEDRNIFHRLFIHQIYDSGQYEKWWQHKLSVSSSQFLKTVYKHTKHKTKLKKAHQGCLRVELRNSKEYLFKMKVLKNLSIEYYSKQ